MKIIKSNEKYIDENNIFHDYFLDKVEYLYEEKKLKIYFLGDKNRTVTFEDVIFTNLQLCGFWGIGYRIMEWYLVDEEPNYKSLLDKQKSWSNNFQILSEENNEYIEMGFLMNSGDTITIICKKIKF